MQVMAADAAINRLKRPISDDRRSMQVQQLSSQVAEQARMIQQLQAQALAPHPQHPNVSPAQQPVLDASRSGLHQQPDEMALAPRGQGLYAEP